MVRPLVLSGPSGSGKTTLLNMLTAKYPNLFEYSAGHTTRAPRQGEIPGVHYNFVSAEIFQEMIQHNEFLEWTYYCSNYYGQAKKTVQAILDRGISPILSIDMNGVLSVKKMGQYMNPKYIFIQAPSLAVLEQRLRERGLDSEVEIKKRIEEARKELEYAHSIPPPHDLIIVNDNLHDAFNLFEKFALE